VLVYFLAYTGLRFGETVALRVQRLDLLRGRCEVVESATEVGSRLEWGPTKSNERRTVQLPRFLAELLGEHLAGRPAGPNALVFTAPQGGPLRERKFLHGQLSRPPAGRACLTRSALTTFGTRPRACSSARAPASRRYSALSATSRR
jgi:integrase